MRRRQQSEELQARRRAARDETRARKARACTLAKEAFGKKRRWTSFPRDRAPRSVEILLDCAYWEHRRRLERALAHLDAVAPELLDEVYFTAIWHASVHPWLRPIEAWRPNAKGNTAIFESLVDHLLTKEARVPKFLYSVFFMERLIVDPRDRNQCYRPGAQTTALVWVFVRVARGENLHDIVKSGGLGVPLTRRMCHIFLGSPASTKPIVALRQAQLRAFGASHELTRAIAGTFLGQALMPDEAFWGTVVEWLAAQSELLPPTLRPLLGYIRFRREGSTRFRMKGRSLAATLTRTVAWLEQTVVQAREEEDSTFAPSGFSGGQWSLPSKEPDRSGSRVLWTVEEIRTPGELCEEGRRQRNCVFTYLKTIDEGLTSIWSLKRRHEEDARPRRALTIEVTKDGAIIQARGKVNRPPKREESQILELWAESAGLELRILF